MSWERARQPEQIEQRRRDILRAAAAVFAAEGLDGASLSAIARAAEISKANIYRYFESREAIFLELLSDDFADWVVALEAALAPLAGSDDAEGLVDAFVHTSAERERLMALVAKLASVLEHNISAETVRAFKRNFLTLSLRVVNAAHAAMPSLSIADAQRFWRFFIAFGTGAYPSTHPPAHVASVMREPEFAALDIGFADAVRDHSLVVLRGLLAADA